MLAHYRIIFAHLKFFGLLTRVLFCCVEIAGIGRTHELHENGAWFGHLSFLNLNLTAKIPFSGGKSSHQYRAGGK